MVQAGSGATWGGQFQLAQAHAFGQDDAEAVKQRGLGGVWLGDAAQADLAVAGGRALPDRIGERKNCISIAELAFLYVSPAAPSRSYFARRWQWLTWEGRRLTPGYRSGARGIDTLPTSFPTWMKLWSCS